MGETVAFLSGKGGTGKTSICAGIAAALARDGQRVLCIDCDVGLRNLDIALGLSETASLSFLDVCSQNYIFEELRSHPRFPTLWFLTAPMNVTPDAIDPIAFDRMLRNAREKFDYIFLDAAAGVDAAFRLAAASADRILVVTGPHPAAVRDAGRVGQLLELMGKTNVRLIVNRISTKLVSAMGCNVDDIMDDAALPLLGVVPDDPAVTLAAAYGKPLLLHTKKGAAAACKRIARRMQGIPTPIDL
jgi:septum site-determining protein MinD